MNNNKSSNRNLKQGLGFFTAAIDAALIYNFTQDISEYQAFYSPTAADDFYLGWYLVYHLLRNRSRRYNLNVAINIF